MQKFVVQYTQRHRPGAQILEYRRRTDRNSREFSESIRGVETYDDPHNDSTVQLDSTYEHAWQLNDGSYVLSNDPSFDPYRALGLEGDKLKVSP